MANGNNVCKICIATFCSIYSSVRPFWHLMYWWQNKRTRRKYYNSVFDAMYLRNDPVQTQSLGGNWRLWVCILWTGKRWFPGQQGDVHGAESVATAEKVHEESDAVRHHDQGSSTALPLITVLCPLSSTWHHRAISSILSKYTARSTMANDRDFYKVMSGQDCQNKCSYKNMSDVVADAFTFYDITVFV